VFVKLRIAYPAASWEHHYASFNIGLQASSSIICLQPTADEVYGIRILTGDVEGPFPKKDAVAFLIFD